MNRDRIPFDAMCFVDGINPNFFEAIYTGKCSVCKEEFKGYKHHRICQICFDERESKLNTKNHGS